MQDPSEFKLIDVRRRFDEAAATFDRADFVHRQTFDGLLERLTPVVIEPARVLDLGCATGSGANALAGHFRRTEIIALDLSLSMLKRARRRGTFLSRPLAVQADARALPLREASINLVVANLLLPWLANPHTLFAEIARVLKPGGVFAFATLGPDSFGVLRDAWASVDADPHVGAFPDMHIIGDALVGAGLADPVLDVDRLTVTYQDIDALFSDLTASGARNVLPGRRKSLAGRGGFAAFRHAVDARKSDGMLAVDLELVFGHAWGAGPRQPAGEFHFDPGAITQRRRR